LLEHGNLDPQIAWRSTWNDVAAAADALFARRINGKAVLDLEKSPRTPDKRRSR
jgi:hypothetical protein